MLYRLAAVGEIPDGRAVDIQDRPGGQAEVLLHPDHTEEPLCEQFTTLAGHYVAHGVWRQRWTNDGRMARPAQGLMLAVSRWETVPSGWMPSGRLALPIEDDGSCVWLIDERYCTEELRNDMNDLLLRLAGDGLWIQMWLRRRPIPAAPAPDPLVAPPLAAPVAV